MRFKIMELSCHKIFLGFLLVVLAMSTLSTTASACMFGPMPDDKALKYYDVVFSGVVEGCFTENEDNFLRYSVNKIWKGEIKEKYTVLVPECAPYAIDPQEIRSLMLIFATRIENTQHLQGSSGLCTSNRPLIVRQQTYFIGIPLPSYFDTFAIEDPKKLGKPIHEFSK